MFKIILVIAVLLLIASLMLVRYLEAKAVFFPSRTMENIPSHMGLAYEDVYFQTSDGVKINAWLVRNPNAVATVIFAHGNAGNMSDRLLKIKFFHDLGLNTLAFDYRGFGKSEGKPSEKGVYLDAQGAYDYLKSRSDVGKIIGYGASLGGAVVIDLASKRPMDAIIIDSSFTSAKDMAQMIYPFVPKFFMNVKFDSLKKIKKVSAPKLFLHSPEDQVVPYQMGVKLYEAALEPKVFLKIHGGHNDGSITSDKQALETLNRFLKENQLL
jgi:fermentation-respiration switch protein FrsA (DUF1100 family)